MIWAWANGREDKIYARLERRYAAQVEARMVTLRDQLRVMCDSSIREPEAARKKPVASVMAHEIISESEWTIHHCSSITPWRAWESSIGVVSAEVQVRVESWEVQLVALKEPITLRAVVSDPESTKLLAAMSIGRFEELVTLLRAIMLQFGCPTRLWFIQPHVAKAGCIVRWAGIHGIELAIRRSPKAKRMAVAE
jgi:hypothetical protein